MANADPGNTGAETIKSSYGDKVMKQALTEIMEQYDTDGNQEIDLQEFMRVVSDGDVDMLLSIY